MTNIIIVMLREQNLTIGSLKKRKQHYVWKYYLKSWTQNGIIYCLQNRKIFPATLKGVAAERDFYQLKELSLADISYIKTVLINPATEHLQKLNLGWIEFFNQIFKLKKFANSLNLKSAEIDGYLDTLINNFEEDYHARIESDAKDIVDAILAEDLSFYDDTKKNINFTQFVSLQYFRTVGMAAIKWPKLPDQPNINHEAVSQVARHIFATNVGRDLFSNRMKYKILLLKNRTPSQFITGDQPVVNTYSVPGKEPEELELYYPFSPSLAILISDKTEYANQEKVLLNENQVLDYNSQIERHSYRQLYASSEKTLQSLGKPFHV